MHKNDRAVIIMCFVRSKTGINLRYKYSMKLFKAEMNKKQ